MGAVFAAGAVEAFEQFDFIVLIIAVSVLQAIETEDVALFAAFAADGLQTAQDPTNPNLIYYESQGGNIARRNLATGELVSVRPRTVTLAQFGNQIRAIRGDGSKPLTPDQEKQIVEIRERMKREMADPNVALRWNWNTPFILSQHDPNVFYSGADKLFKSVKKGEAPYAISPDLTARNPD